MKPTLLAFLLAAVCGGVAGAMLTRALSRDPNTIHLKLDDAQPVLPAPSPRNRPEALLTEPSAPVEARLSPADLERPEEEKERRALVESELATRVEALTARVAELEKALANLPAPRVPKEALAETLAEVRKDEFVEKIETYQEERAARLEEDLVKMRDWLELDDYQADEMRVALQLQYDRELEQTRIWKETGDNEAVGELKKADGELFAEDLSRFLTPEQSEIFWTGNRGAGSGKGSGR